MRLQVEGSKYKREFKPKKAVVGSEAGIRASNKVPYYHEGASAVAERIRDVRFKFEGSLLN